MCIRLEYSDCRSAALCLEEVATRHVTALRSIIEEICTTNVQGMVDTVDISTWNPLRLLLYVISVAQLVSRSLRDVEGTFQEGATCKGADGFG